MNLPKISVFLRLHFVFVWACLAFGLTSRASQAGSATWALDPDQVVLWTNASGTVFTAISNTAAGPIAGAFSNLPDDSTITIGNNSFQANYQGGDGNDLTLTVVP